LISVNGSEEEITITLNTGVLQTLLETIADELINVFKANWQVPEQSDDKVRGDILRELRVIKEALVKPMQPSQSLANESLSKPIEVKHNEPGPSASSQSSNSADGVIDLTVDSEQEDQGSESVISEQSPKVGKKRSREDCHLSSPPTKRACSSSANSKNADDAASKSISVVSTSQQHTIMDLSQYMSLNLPCKTLASGNMSANVACRSSQEKQNELILATSSGLASPSDQSSLGGEPSATFTSLKRSSSRVRSNFQKTKSNQDPSPNVPSTPECVQQAETVTSKSDESSNDSQYTRNTTNYEKSIAGPSHKAGSGVLSEKPPTGEASTSTKLTFDSQGSATSKRTNKRFKQSQPVVHNQKQPETGTGHDLSLLNPTEGEVTGGKGPSRECTTPKQPRRKGTHSTSQESSSKDRKRGSRCPKSKRHLCPVCSKLDCGKCKNCL
jgi:hypothetical protein